MNDLRGRVVSRVVGGITAGVIVASSAMAAGADRAALVNPLVGTTNGGNVFPGATMPFGMVQFSPEATPVNAKRMIAAPGGYEYRATKIRGFSLTNVEGWGCAGASGDVPLMPITDEIGDSPSKDFRQEYAAAFTHADEVAEPGSYRVKLGNGVAVALGAGTRMGAAMFTFPEGKAARVLVRTSDSEVGSTAAETRVDRATGMVTGSVTSGNFCGYIGTEDRRPYYTLYYVMKFDQPVTETGTSCTDSVRLRAVTTMSSRPTPAVAVGVAAPGALGATTVAGVVAAAPCAWAGIARQQQAIALLPNRARARANTTRA